MIIRRHSLRYSPRLQTARMWAAIRSLYNDLIATPSIAIMDESLRLAQTGRRYWRPERLIVDHPGAEARPQDFRCYVMTEALGHQFNGWSRQRINQGIVFGIMER